jgi:hypothetical protein
LVENVKLLWYILQLIFITELSNSLRLKQQSRAEQSRAEQSRAEQSRAEQSRAEQSRAEQSRAEQSRAEQSTAYYVIAQHSTQHSIAHNTA